MSLGNSPETAAFPPGPGWHEQGLRKGKKGFPVSSMLWEWGMFSLCAEEKQDVDNTEGRWGLN